MLWEVLRVLTDGNFFLPLERSEGEAEKSENGIQKKYSLVEKWKEENSTDLQ
jgi:hypothetical protein